MSKPAGVRNKLPKDIADIRKAFEKYVDETALPIVCDFAVKHGVSRTVLDRPELKAVKEKCLMKKEAALETGGLEGTKNATMAIFSLKQLGWKDKIETTNEHTIQGIRLITLTPEEYRAQRDGEAAE